MAKNVDIVLMDQNNQSEIMAKIKINPAMTLQDILQKGNKLVRSKGIIPDRYSLRLFLSETIQ